MTDARKSNIRRRMLIELKSQEIQAAHTLKIRQQTGFVRLGQFHYPPATLGCLTIWMTVSVRNIDRMKKVGVTPLMTGGTQDTRLGLSMKKTARYLRSGKGPRARVRRFGHSMNAGIHASQRPDQMHIIRYIQIGNKQLFRSRRVIVSAAP